MKQRTFMMLTRVIYLFIVISSIFLLSARGTWIHIQLRDGSCGNAEFRSGDTVWFSYWADRDCTVTVIKDTPWREKTIVDGKEILAGVEYTGYFDIGTGVTRSDWWKIIITAKNNFGEETKAECSFYVPYTPKTGDIKVIVEDQDDYRIGGTKIYLDGDYKGKTNSSGIYYIEDLDPDNYTVKASKSGYEDDSETVYVESGETKTVYLTLKDPCWDVTCPDQCRGHDLWAYECEDGECVPDYIIEENCSECGYDPCADVTCPEDSYVGEKYCKSGDVYRKYRDYYCENGECKYREEERRIEDCNYGCENSGCMPKPTTATPTTRPATTSPPTTTTPPTTSPYTPPSSQSGSFAYIGVFAGIIVLFLVIYQMTRKKPEKIKEELFEKESKKEVIVEKSSKHCPFCGKLISLNVTICPYCKKDLEITPELKELLEEEKEWKEKLERLKTKKSKLEEKIYEEKYNEIMDKLVDIKDKIIKEKMKRGKKK